MPWFRLDDSFHSHPKVIAAGNEAAGLFVRCGTYAAQHLTDGFIREDVALLYGSNELAGTLVRVGLWHRARGGWRIHDYLDYNPSADQVKQERKQAAARQKRRRDAIVSRRDSRRESPRESQDPVPTRPDPSLKADVDIQSADRNGRASPDLIELIITEVRARTGRSLSDDWAQRTYQTIVGGRELANPAAYVREAIRREPNPRTRFLPLY